jgi:hypothetical protein
MLNFKNTLWGISCNSNDVYLNIWSIVPKVLWYWPPLICTYMYDIVVCLSQSHELTHSIQLHQYTVSIFRHIGVNERIKRHNWTIYTADFRKLSLFPYWLMNKSSDTEMPLFTIYCQKGFILSNDIGSFAWLGICTTFMTYHRVCNKINTTGATRGTGTAYPTGALEFTRGLWWTSRWSIVNFLCDVL